MRFSRSVLLSTTALLLAPQIVMAQEITSAIRGTVTNEAGAPVAGVTVTVTHEPTGSVSVEQTNANGNFFLSGLRPGGPYTISVADQGTLTAEDLSGVELAVNRTFPARIVMRDMGAAPATVDSIVVTGFAFESIAEGGGSSSYGSEVIDKLPSIQRDFKDAIRLNPFVDVDDITDDNEVSITAVNNRFNSITVDGVTQNDDFGLNASGVPTQRTPISPLAIEQVAVNPAPFDVEFGGFQGGSINIVTKSGGNEFFGEAFYQYGDEDWKGDEADGEDISFAPFKEEQFGGAVGGPIIRDTLFFFGAYEKYESGTPLGFSVDDVDGVTQADLESIDQIVQSVYNFDPLDRDGAGDELPQEDEKIFVRLDWNINDDHRAFVSYQETSGNELQPQNQGRDAISFLSNWYNRTEELKAYNGQIFSDWGANLSTEVKVGYRETITGQTPLGGDDFAEFIVILDSGDEVVLGGDPFRQANDLSQETWFAKFKADYSWGDHLFTLGYEWNQLDVFNLFRPFSDGVYEFSASSATADVNGDGRIDGIDALAQQRADSVFYENAVTGDPNDGAAEFQITTHTFYLQDEYVPSWMPDLTLNAGVRVDLFSSDDEPTLNPFFVTRNGFPNTENLDGKYVVQPRFGFRYDLDEDNIFRGGVGLFSGGSPRVWLGNAFSNPGVGVDNVFIGRSFATPDQLSNILDGLDGFTEPAALTAELVSGDGIVDATDPDFDIPSLWKFNLAYERYQDIPYLGDDWHFTFEMILTRVQDAVQWVELVRETQPTLTAPDGSPIYSTLDSSAQDVLLTNTDEGGANIFAFGFDKTWDDPDLTFFGSYTYTDAFIAAPGTSSRASSNYEFTIHTDRNQALSGTSQFETEHNVKLGLLWEDDIVAPDIFTKLSLIYIGRSGDPYSLTFDQSSRFERLPFGGTNDADSGDSHLLYVPTAAESSVLGDGSMTPVEFETQADLDAFNAMVDALDLERGDNVGKNTFQNPWTNQLDLYVGQEIPSPVPGKFEVFFAIENLLNLIDSDLGAVREYSFPNVGAVEVASGAEVSPGVFDTSVFDPSTGAGSTLLYRDIDNPVGDEFLNRNESVWTINFGVRYEF